MVLEVLPKFNKNELIADEYQLIQYNELIEYPNTRLVRAGLTWNCYAATHEWWGSPESKTKGTFYNLRIHDLEDGGHKKDKFERDYKLLLDEINDPETREDIRNRDMFYLGQTCRDLRKYQESNDWYKKRIKTGGWDEETFYATMQIGINYWSLNMKEIATGWLLKAWEMRPGRAEPLHSIANMHRVDGNNYIALLFALQGKTIPKPRDCLFVNYQVYKYLFDEEISINAFYVRGMRHLGKRATKKLIAMKDEITEGSYELACDNSKHYDNAGPLAKKESDEETMKKFNAILQIGLNYWILGEKEMATGWLLRAWEAQPSRAEPLYHIANLHRLDGNNRIALLFALQGKTIPRPKSGSLFVNERIYKYLLDEEVSITALYVPGMRDYGRKAITKLLSMKEEITKDSYGLACSNARSYGIKLESDESTDINELSIEIAEKEEEKEEIAEEEEEEEEEEEKKEEKEEKEEENSKKLNGMINGKDEKSDEITVLLCEIEGEEEVKEIKRKKKNKRKKLGSD